MLLIFGGCRKAAFQTKDHDVTINNCVATPDEVTVHEGDKVFWKPEQSDQRDYTISFWDRNEPTPNPITVKHGINDLGHLIKGHKNCYHGQHGDFYCKYNIASNDNLPSCLNDPGIHIIP